MPAGAGKDLSAAQAKALLASVRPRDVAGQDPQASGRGPAGRPDPDRQADQGGHRRAGDHGSGPRQHPDGPARHRPSGPARLLGDVGDVTRIADRDRFASWNNTAPLDASSGDHRRHRLSRAGNRRINRVLHMMAVSQLRSPASEGRAYYDRKRAEGKTPMEARRCLKRKLSDVVYRRMLDDLATTTTLGTDPGGDSGATPDSCAADLHPVIGASEQPLPGPATTNPRTAHPATA
jgi:transposase